jgi:hypothetical protein
MRFQVGKRFCELSLDGDGRVEARWFDSHGRKLKPPHYLDAADRRQYRAGREAFLRGANKLSVRLGPQAARSWRALRRLAPVLVVAAMLTGCAHGGGIGLEAMIADQQCEQVSYEIGTPEYAQCRMALQQQSAINAAAMQAFYQRQAELARQNQAQTCLYNGSNIGGITGTGAFRQVPVGLVLSLASPSRFRRADLGGGARALLG